MSNLQVAWIIIGLIIGAVMFIPIRRCLSTHNGLLSMLTASLMGIFNIGAPWIAIVVACFFFTYGTYRNRHKFLGETSHD